MVVLFLLFTSIRSYYRVKQRNTEILALNSEIRKHRHDLILQRDALVEKNMKIESLHQELSDINKSLEQTVLQRTEALKDQNKHLEEYAFITAHKLRAPLARVLGLINLLEKNVPIEEQRLLLEHLKNASCELDNVIRSVSRTLHEGMKAFDSETPDTEKPTHRSSTS
jgi:light-regulated signal transduction histidine kinase (bacteriophytochrome)